MPSWIQDKFWYGLAVFGAIVVLVWFASTYLLQSTVITVVGQGKISVPPDEVTFVVTKVTQSSDATAALTQGEQDIKRLVDIVKSAAPGSEIQQAFNQVTPQVGNQYLASNAFSVKAKNVTDMNGLMKSLYSSGATGVSNVVFKGANQDKIEQDAQASAIKNAHEKADRLASSAGKHLGRMVSVADDNSGGASTLSSGTNIDIVKQVSVVFEIW